MDIRAAKQSMRNAIRKSLLGMSMVEVERQSNVIYNTIARHEWFIKAQTIGLYMSMPSEEVQTHSILNAALDLKKRVYIPKMLDDRIINFYRICDIQSVKEGKWNIPEPTSELNCKLFFSLLD